MVTVDSVQWLSREQGPDKNLELDTEEGLAFHQKTDIYRGLYWYGFEKNNASNIVPVPVERAKEIIRLNKEGKKVKALIEDGFNKSHKLEFQSDIVKGDLTRFDSRKPKGKRKKKKKGERKGPKS